MRLNLRRFDFVLLACTVIMSLFGIAMVYSATLNVPTYESYPVRQIVYVLIGLVLLIATAAFDYRLLTALQWPLLIIMLILLAAVKALGQVRGGTAGWFDAGVVLVQPAEIAKVLFIIVFAQYLASRHEEMHKPQWVVLAFVLIGLPVALIYLQPDLGTAMVFLVVGALMLFAADLPWAYIVAAVVSTALMVPIVWNNMQEYMQSRILIFLDPSSDPDANFNVAQALISIGNGGLLGKGFAQGSQSQLHFLRVRYADFIFSVIAEELGFIGALILIVLLAILLLRLLSIADQARDTFGRYLVIGVAAMIMFQGIVSIGMNLGLMPVTGITLPFISYGGSSLLTLMIGIGLAESVAMRSRKIEFD